MLKLFFKLVLILFIAPWVLGMGANSIDIAPKNQASLNLQKTLLSACSPNSARNTESASGTSTPSGTITGNVDDDGGADLSGATVYLQGYAATYTTTTDASGNYTLSNVPPDTYTVVGEKTSYNGDTEASVVVEDGVTTSGVDLVLTLQTGTVTGKITDAQNGNALSGATVYISGYQATLTTTTNGSGEYSIANVPIGTHTVIATMATYADGQQSDVTVTNAATTDNVNISLLPASLTSNMYAIVLTWDDTPEDLDAQILVPTGGSGTRVFYGTPGNISVSPHATLDIDKTGGKGPETMTVRTYVDGGTGDVNCTTSTAGDACYTGEYKYFVHKYSGTGALTTSSAVVTLYKDGVLVKQYNIPTSGTGDYWLVFSLNATTVTDKDLICDNRPTLAADCPP